MTTASSDDLISHFDTQIEVSNSVAMAASGDAILLYRLPETQLHDCNTALSQLVSNGRIDDFAYVPAIDAYAALRPADQGGA